MTGVEGAFLNSAPSSQNRLPVLEHMVRDMPVAPSVLVQAYVPHKHCELLHSCGNHPQKR